jgi:hypothetical protein
MCEVFRVIFVFLCVYKLYSKLIGQEIEGKEHEAAGGDQAFLKVFLWYSYLSLVFTIFIWLFNFVCIVKYLCIFCSDREYVIYKGMSWFCPKWWQRNPYKVMVSVVGWPKNPITMRT